MLLQKLGTFSAASELYYGFPHTSTNGCTIIKEFHMTRTPPAMASDAYVLSGGLVRNLAKSSVPPLCTSGGTREECTCEHAIVSFWVAPYDIKRIFEQEREWLYHLPSSVRPKTKSSGDLRAQSGGLATNPKLTQASSAPIDSVNAIQLSNGLICERDQATPETTDGMAL